MFSTSGAWAQSNFGLYILLLIIFFFDQDVILYVCWGKKFKNAVRFDEILTEKKVWGKNHVVSSEPPHHFMIQHFWFWFVEMCGVEI